MCSRSKRLKRKQESKVHNDDSLTHSLLCLSQRHILTCLFQHFPCSPTQEQIQQGQTAHGRHDVGLIKDPPQTKPGFNLHLKDYKYKINQKSDQSQNFCFMIDFFFSTHYSRHYIDGPAQLSTPVSPASGTTALVLHKMRLPPTNLSSRPLAVTSQFGDGPAKLDQCLAPGIVDELRNCSSLLR